MTVCTPQDCTAWRALERVLDDFIETQIGRRMNLTVL